MLIATSLDGRVEPLNNIGQFEMEEEISGAFEIRFISFSIGNNPGHELLEEEAIVTVEGYDFRIKQLAESKGTKKVTAVSTFYDNVGERQDDFLRGTNTLEQYASFALKGTGWSFINLDVFESAIINDFGDDNAIKLIQALCAAFECEYKILPGKSIQFAKKVGPDNDAQYRYGHNVKTLSKFTDSTNLRTVIKGYGTNDLVVTYTSPNAARLGEREADPIHDDDIATPESMIKRLKQELIDYPEVSFELDTVELLDRELGERVWLIYEPMNIEFQTRILSKKSGFRNNHLVTMSVVLGNTTARSMSEILTSQKVEIDRNKKETRSKFEQTNDRITLEVEAINESIASINIRADSIELSVRSLDGRIGSAEATLTVQAGLIATKVSKDGVISSINQSPEAITLNANRINMIGITTVAHELHVGGDFRDNTSKAIYFRGRTGGVVVSSPSLDNMYIGAGSLHFDANYVQFNSGATISGLNLTAKFG